MATTHTRLSYHPFLSNFFNDELIMRLEARYGCIGSYFVIYIRCMLYDNGYYLKCDKEIVSIICRKLCGEISTETALEIIDFLLDNAFFDKEIYQKHGILTSLETKKHFRQRKQSPANSATPMRRSEFFHISEIKRLIIQLV